jgi:hypothetical protein
MRVEVLRIDERSRMLTIAALGSVFQASWHGEWPAALGVLFGEVELSLIDWSEVELQGDGAGRHEYDCPTGTNVVQAIVEDYGYDGVVRLRVGDEYVLVDSIGEPPLGIVGRTIRFRTNSAEVYPYDL